MSDTQSQKLAILADLKRGRAITPLDALRRYGSLRLSGRILELRKDGWDIKTTIIETGSGARVARYSLARKRKAA